MEKEQLKEIYDILEKNNKIELKNKLKNYIRKLNKDNLVKENNKIGVTSDGFYFIK